MISIDPIDKMFLHVFLYIVLVCCVIRMTRLVVLYWIFNEGYRCGKRARLAFYTRQANGRDLYMDEIEKRSTIFAILDVLIGLVRSQHHKDLCASLTHISGCLNTIQWSDELGTHHYGEPISHFLNQLIRVPLKFDRGELSSSWIGVFQVGFNLGQYDQSNESLGYFGDFRSKWILDDPLSYFRC